MDPIRRTLPPVLLILLIALSVQPPSATAQAVFDGVTVGTGVSMYRGDLDHNPDDNVVRSLASSTPHLFVAGEREVGRVVFEGVMSYDRLRLLHTGVDGRLNVLSLDLTLGIPLGLPEPYGVRVFAGLTPTLLVGDYRRVSDSWVESLGYEPVGTKPYLTIPFGIVFQDVLRIGMRLAIDDGFDGMTRGAITDAVAFISIGHRFDFTR